MIITAFDLIITRKACIVNKNYKMPATAIPPQIDLNWAEFIEDLLSKA